MPRSARRNRRDPALLILGEEDAEEVHRRIHRAARHEQASMHPNGAIVTLLLTGIAR